MPRNIALRNEKLTVKELNFAVQQTIDRIIFLRICEDRGIETYGRLLALQNGDRVYKRLMEVFYAADKKYNSGLFDFNSDKLSHTLDIDDKVLKELIEGIYYPNSPYEFSVIGADILGNVYEQFLGKVIRLTAGHTAKVDEKPEVKRPEAFITRLSISLTISSKTRWGNCLEMKLPRFPLARGDRGGNKFSLSTWGRTSLPPFQRESGRDRGPARGNLLLPLPLRERVGVRG